MNRRKAIMALPFLAALPWLSKSGDGDGMHEASEGKKRIKITFRESLATPAPRYNARVMGEVAKELKSRGAVCVRAWSVRPEAIGVDWSERHGPFPDFSAPIHETEFDRPASEIVDRIWPESVKGVCRG